MSKKLTLLEQAKERLDGQLAIGESKHADKIRYRKDADGKLILDADGHKIIENKDATAHKIYSWNTYRTYLKHSNYFVQWCRKEYGCKTLQACKKHCDEYLEKLIAEEKSAYTVKLTACALAKLYKVSSKDFTPTPTRQRKNIARSRGETVRDHHFSEKNNAELISFCRCTGLRRAELSQLRGDDLIEKDGKYFLKIHRATKGGRERVSPIVGSEKEIMAVVERMQKSGTGKVWSKVSGNADIHGYRSEYCTRVYKMYARDIKDISDRKEIYYCRSDLKGVRYDKAAMLKASKALGHNRINVIASHYLRA